MPKKVSSSCSGCCGPCGLSRRNFLAGGLAATSLPLAAQLSSKDAARQQPVRLALRVQPVLVYQIFQRKEATSWRPWGGILTEQDAAQEKERIGRELATMKASADFPLEVLPLAIAKDPLLVAPQ